MRRLGLALSLIFTLALAASAAQAQEKWVTAWAASVQGPYPIGNPSAFGSSNAAHGSPEHDAKRKALNEFIRTSGLFDRRAQARIRAGKHHRRPRATSFIPAAPATSQWAWRLTLIC